MNIQYYLDRAYFRLETEEIKSITRTFQQCIICEQSTAGYATYGDKQSQLVFLCNQHNNRIHLEMFIKTFSAIQEYIKQ